MEALVFAAGRGTRMGSLTEETPKPLLEVGGEPILSRCLRATVDAGIDRVVLVVGYREDLIRERFGEAFEGVPITYAHQHERKGLAHAVRTGSPYVSGEDVLCVNGDNVFDGDLSTLVETHRDPDVDGTLLLDRVSRNEAETTALCDLESDGTIRRVESNSLETPEAGYVAAGAQTHTNELFDACRAVGRADSGEYELADALQLLVDRGRRYVGIELEGWHLNVNTPEDLAAARRHFDSNA